MQSEVCMHYTIFLENRKYKNEWTSPICHRPHTTITEIPAYAQQTFSRIFSHAVLDIDLSKLT